ncbi:MAG: zinc-ribbon domain-containing protein [Acidobacteria bacterium]|nr:zinc-ribbon domain-containing protein [Acidobacteriota bacterium]
MSEPEIARRCLSCGASVRGHASFCPQCGSRLAGATTEGENHPAAAMTGAMDEPRPPARGSSSMLVEEAARVAATLNDKLPTLSEETAASGNHKPAPERELEPPETREEAATPGAHTRQSFAGEDSVAEPATETTTASPAETRGRIGRRAATVGASVGENLRPRVEKLREASTVVLDEAADDPGTRFVIIAVVLFLLFLFILLFSYILG